MRVKATFSRKMRQAIRRRMRRAVALAAAAALSLQTLAAPALALPQGGEAVWGEVEISTAGPAMTVVQQSEKAILHWDAFDIAGGESVRFVQPGRSAVALNRVLGTSPSTIDGRLTADGQIFLLNPNGVLFGAGARVDAAAVVASTLALRDADFLAGRYRFGDPAGGAGNAGGTATNAGGAVANAGEITVAPGGYVALIGGRVENTGTITAPGGSVGLVAGGGVTLDFEGDGLLRIAVDEAAFDAQAANGGLIEAEGGLVVMSARARGELTRAAINMDGVIRAASLDGRGGVIRLLGEGEGTVEVSGTLDAGGTASGDSGGPGVDAAGVASPGDGKAAAPAGGGTIVVTGEHVVLGETARLDASGATGGVILVGGDRYGGRSPGERFVAEPVRNATTTSVAAGALLRADGRTGDGGAVVVWSDEVTQYAGAISARGGSAGTAAGASAGSGGFAEVSGKRLLSYRGTADLRGGPGGAAGTLLLDPYNVTITDDPTAGMDISGGTFTPNADNSVLLADDVVAALGTGNVVITTGGEGSPGSEAGDILVKASIVWEGPTTLTLSAYRDIEIDNANGAQIKNIATAMGSGHLVLRADSSGRRVGTVRFTDPGGFTGLPGVDFTESAGTVSIYYNPLSNTQAVNPDAGEAVNPVSYAQADAYEGMSLPNFDIEVWTGPDSVLYGYMLVHNVYDLQNMQNNLLTQPFFQRSDRRFGYALSRDIDAGLTGHPDGWIDADGDPDTTDGFAPIGMNSMFPFAGIFDGQGHVIDGLFINRGGTDQVGLFSWIEPVDAFSDPPAPVVRNVGLTNVNITGQWYVGGVVGLNSGGVVERTYVTGVVRGTGDRVGGVVGETNGGRISQSYSTAAVIGENDVGGLVGSSSGHPNPGIIEDSYATGPVQGVQNVGGLLGMFYYAGTVRRAYATGSVKGDTNVGGLIGYIEKVEDVTIQHAFYDADSTGVAEGIGAISDSDPTGLDVTAIFDPFGAATYDEPGDPTDFNFGAADSPWGIVEGVSYPYLVWRFPKGPSVVSGNVFGVAGGNDTVGIGVGVDGRFVATTWSGANGAYYETVDPVEADSAALVWLDGTRIVGRDFATVADRANSLTEFGPDGHATNLDLHAGDVRLTTGTAHLSTVFERATGNLDDDPALADLIAYGLASSVALDAGMNLVVNAAGPSFTIDRVVLAQGTGSITVTSAGALTLGDGRVVAVQGGSVTLNAVGDLTLNPDSFLFAPQATGNFFVLSTGGDFRNLAGPEALSYNLADAEARWLIYIADLEGNEYGGLDSGNRPVWGATIDSLPPEAVSEEGNRYLFAYRPTLTFTSKDLTKTYGEDVTDLLADPDPDRYTVSGIEPGVPGAFLGDTLETAFIGKPFLTSDGAAADADVTPGGYAIIIEGGIETDYNVVFVSTGVLTVEPKRLTVEGITAESREYDGTTVVSLNVADAYLVGEIEDGDAVELIFTSPFGSLANKDVGVNKAVTVNGVTLDGPDSHNYVLEFAGVTATISVRTVVVTLTGEVRKTYDATTAAPMTPAHFTLSNAIAGDDVYIAGGTGAYDTPDAGSGKLVTVTGLVLGGFDAPNYSLNVVDVSAAVGVIDKALLTVRANDVTIGPGQPLPEFSVTYNGFVGGENVSVLGGELTFVTTATEGSPPGSYSITPGGLTAANYEIEFVPGVLTIQPFGGQTVNELIEQLSRNGNPHVAALLQDERVRELLGLIGACQVEDVLNLLAYASIFPTEIVIQMLTAYGASECMREVDPEALTEYLAGIGF